MKSNSKIIALDLQNASVENLNYWLLTTNFITTDVTRNYIRDCITSWNNDDEPIQILYITNNFIFGAVRKNNFPAIEFHKPLIEELLQLIPINLDEIVLYRSVIIDWIFNSNSTRTTTALALRAFQKYDDILEKRLCYPSFVSCVSSIEVRELGFNLKEFFLPLNDKFKAIVQEFRNYYGKGNYLKTVILTRIFILGNIILGYIFQLEGESYKHFFWNIHLEDRLLLIDKFSFEDKIPLTLDTVLDKIHLVGMEQLTEEERKILTQNTK
jgi:hypothetical protein